MKPTLFVLAAGMGSRYGGLKQLDGLGPNGETIMDYSIYDAVRAGFGKIVFVIRHSFEEEFRNKVISKYEKTIPVEVVFQEIEYVPEGCTYNTERTKPWGTNHAVLMGRDVINEPFAVINSDDFYGRESYKILADFLNSKQGKKNEYCVVGYRMGNTLSEIGSVNRGVCELNGKYLKSIVERTDIARNNGKIQFVDENGQTITVQEDTPVSMNMWGFTPDYFQYSEDFFRTFVNEHGQELKSEFYIPTLVDHLIVNGIATCEVLDTPSKWFGVTYAQDRPQFINKINQLIKENIYPQKLWE